MASAQTWQENFKKAEESFFVEEDYTGALVYLEKVITEYPEMVYAYNLGAMAHGKLGNYDQALTDLQKVLAIDPKDGFANDLVHSIDPRDGVAYDLVHSEGEFKDKLLGAILVQENFYKTVKCLNSGDYRGAIVHLEKIIDATPGAVDSYMMRATANRALGNLSEALADLERVIDIDWNNEVALSHRDELLKSGLVKPIKQTNGIYWDPNNRLDHYLLDNIFEKTGEYTKAIVYLDKFIAENPADIAAYRSRGLAHTRLQNNDKALADFNRALSIDPYDKWVLNAKDQLYKVARVESNFDKAVGCMDAHNYQLAIAYLDEVLRDTPKDWRAYGNRARCFQELGYYYEAILDVERAMTIDPDNPELGNFRVFLLSSYWPELVSKDPRFLDVFNTIPPPTEFGPSNRYPLESFDSESQQQATQAMPQQQTPDDEGEAEPVTPPTEEPTSEPTSVSGLMEKHNDVIEHMYERDYGKDNPVVSLEEFKADKAEEFEEMGAKKAKHEISVGYKKMKAAQDKANEATDKQKTQHDAAEDKKKKGVSSVDSPNSENPRDEHKDKEFLEKLFKKIEKEIDEERGNT